MWSKLTIKTPERRHWRRSGVFIVNVERISCCFSCGSMVDFEYYLLRDFEDYLLQVSTILKYRLQISLLILNKFKSINLWFFDDFRGINVN